MDVNGKKPIRLKNRTNYFDPDTTKVSVTVASPYSYQSRQIKIEGYETRLYWQYRYCESVHGQTFFYTLTYNDASIPHHYGVNCFDYEDLRDLLTGGFRKMLLRKYGTKFKYFVGAELGDGKGVRGMHNNPHYHVLFFLEPANNEKYPYKVIAPEDFRHLVRIYWQGFDESVDGYRDYNKAKYGIAREGDNLGKVIDFRACMYCAKYVCKDVKLKANEKEVYRQLRFQVEKEYLYSEETYERFFKDIMFSMYNVPLDAKCTKWLYTEAQLINLLNKDANLPIDAEIRSYGSYIPEIIEKEGLWYPYNEFVQSYIDPYIEEGLAEWRNRFCNKCRISHGVGDFALEHIEDIMNPTIQVPSKRGFKNRPIGMYYYRKLYTDVVKDSRGSILRVLNELGIKYKSAGLPTRIHKKIMKTKSNYDIIMSNRSLWDKMYASDVNTEVTMTYDYFKKRMETLLKYNSIDEIIRKYAEYKLVYEDRFFALESDRSSDVHNFPDIDVIGDYERFLVPSFYSVPRNDLMLDAFLEDTPENYLPYYAHPYFLRFLSVFAVFDLCADYFFVQEDDKRQHEAEERSIVKRFHDEMKLRDFYANFKKL